MYFWKECRPEIKSCGDCPDVDTCQEEMAPHIPAFPAADEWHPIAEALRDGTEILAERLFGNGTIICLIHWSDDAKEWRDNEGTGTYLSDDEIIRFAIINLPEIGEGGK